MRSAVINTQEFYHQEINKYFKTKLLESEIVRLPPYYPECAWSQLILEAK